MVTLLLAANSLCRMPVAECTPTFTIPGAGGVRLLTARTPRFVSSYRTLDDDIHKCYTVHMEPMSTEEIRESIRSGLFTVSGLALKLGRSRRDLQEHVGKEEEEEGKEAYREQIIREVAGIAFDKKYDAKDRLRAFDMLGKEYDVFADKGDRAVKDSLVEILRRAHAVRVATVVPTQTAAAAGQTPIVVDAVEVAAKMLGAGEPTEDVI